MNNNIIVYLAEKRLIQTDKTSVLKGIRLGIDGHHWLRKVIGKDAYSVAMGGSPWTFRSAVERELEAFRRAEIEPIFVFSGISPLKKEKPFATEDSRPFKRNAGWESYEKGNDSHAINVWGSTASSNHSGLIQELIQILHEKEIEFFRAPYLCIPQLAYFNSEKVNYFHLVYAGSELLLYDVERVIVSLDIENDTFNWIDKGAVLYDLRLDNQQFLDTCLLAGSDYCPTFPPFSEPMASFNFRSTVDAVRQLKSGFSVIKFYIDRLQNPFTDYMDQFLRSRCQVRFHFVMTENGTVVPLNHEHAPKYLMFIGFHSSDLHDLIGPRLPNSIFQYLFIGLISPQVLNTLVVGVLAEYPPLCNGSSKTYQSFVKELLPIRTQTLNLLSSSLHNFYQERKVTTFYWFDSVKPYPMEHRFKPSLNEQLKWTTNNEVLRNEMKRLKKDKIDFSFCCNFLTNNRLSTIKKDGATKSLDRNEVMAMVIWKVFELKGYIDADHALTANGKIFLDKTKFSHELFLVIELVKHKLLHGRSEIQDPNESAVARHVRLISRTVSLLSAAPKPFPWSGKLNRELLVFNSFVRTLSRSLRNLFEMTLLSVVLSSNTVKKDVFFGIQTELPFLSDANTSLGIITNYYLTTENVNEANIVGEFPSCAQPWEDLQRGFLFWDQVFSVIGLLFVDKEIPESLFKEFEGADSWLKGKR